MKHFSATFIFKYFLRLQKKLLVLMEINMTELKNIPAYLFKYLSHKYDKELNLIEFLFS